MLSISVIVPTLNESARIASLVASLHAQDYDGPLEILVVDGGSEDDTIVTARDAGARVLAYERGVSKQRNKGGREATGELLIFMDADDLPRRDFVRRVTKSYARLPFAVACPWFVARDAGFGARLSYWAFNVLFYGGQSWLRMGSGVCLITPRRVFQALNGFDEALHLGEDIHYLRRAAPRFGLHRHLLVGLETSGRRFSHEGAARLMLFYARITPLLLFGCWRQLQRVPYRALEESKKERVT